MFTASLINAGADPGEIINRMRTAASELGDVHIEYFTLQDGSGRLKIVLDNSVSTLSGNEAKKIISKTFDRFGTDRYYREFGNRILNFLLKAEARAHREHPALKHMKNHSSESDLYSSHLHEARDIVIDIVGAAAGMEQLQLNSRCILLFPVSTGSGKVKFSHGLLDVPAPATAILLEENSIPWEKGPVETEMCTPTGAAILASFEASLCNKIPHDLDNYISGSSRGQKDLPVKPLKIFIQ